MLFFCRWGDIFKEKNTMKMGGNRKVVGKLLLLTSFYVQIAHKNCLTQEERDGLVMEVNGMLRMVALNE